MWVHEEGVGYIYICIYIYIYILFSNLMGYASLYIAVYLRAFRDHLETIKHKGKSKQNPPVLCMEGCFHLESI